MNLRNAETGEIIWQDMNWQDTISSQEKHATLPASILTVPSISREIVFSSVASIQRLHVCQKVYVHDECAEDWSSTFGFVIPNSTNSWQHTVEADIGNMIPASVLSGKTIIRTSFHDGDIPLSEFSVRLFYVYTE
ncbi:hypothetical protein SpCBS45565_g06577 [Spizellomyces sp. 'palustris']|nr:hypothetical protein SpCBS45565_g06577 [Spizellomyces sp. 'palustris']